MDNKPNIGDFIKLSPTLKESVKTNYSYAKIERISENGQILDLYFINKDIVENTLNSSDINMLTFCFHHYDVNC